MRFYNLAGDGCFKTMGYSQSSEGPVQPLHEAGPGTHTQAPSLGGLAFPLEEGDQT